MIEKVVRKSNLKEHHENSINDDLNYWLNRQPEERIEAVEFLRKQFYGSTTRLQRSVRVIQRS
jgi:hypothetical protein